MKHPTVIITGASSGLGASMAEEFFLKGYNVVLTARRANLIQSLADKLNNANKQSNTNQPKAIAVECDVTNKEQIQNTVAKAISEFGQVDGYVANAGFGVAGRCDQLSADDYTRQLDTNFYGVLHGFYAVRECLEKTMGFYAVVGSVNSYLSIPTTSAYAVSKFAVRAWAEALYWEMRPKNVAITLICPGFVETEIRKVNNHGVLKNNARDSIPAWIQMPAKQAAKISVRAILKRKKEKIVTIHAHIAIWITRFFPWMLYPILKAAAEGKVSNRSKSIQ